MAVAKIYGIIWKAKKIIFLHHNYFDPIMPHVYMQRSPNE